MLSRDRILELQFENSHSFVLREITTNTAGQEYYLDMTDPLMAYEDGGVLFVNIGLMFERYNNALAIKLGAGINALDQDEWDHSPFDRYNTFIYDLDAFIAISYSRPYPSDFPPLTVFFDSTNDKFIIRDDNTSLSVLEVPYSSYVDGNLFENFSVNGFDFSFGISQDRFYFYIPYPSYVFYDLGSYFSKYGSFDCPECPPAQTDTSLFSLNGNLDTYPNGTLVQIFPSSRDYTVESSFLFRNDENQFIPMYWIIDTNGKRVSVPHNFLIIPAVEGA